MSAGPGAARRRIAAVVRREMRALARYRTPFVLRTVYAGLVAAPIAIIFANLGGSSPWSGQQLAYFGYQSFMVMVWLQSLLAVGLGILMGVVSVAAERRERTLGLVMLSPMRPSELLLGKLTGLLALLSTVLLAGLPVYALIGWAGGVDYLWFACMVAFTAVLAVLGLASGLTAAIAVRNGLGAVVCASICLILPTVVGAIWQEPLADEPLVLPARLLGSILWALAAVSTQNGDLGWFACDLLFLSAVAAALLRYAVAILPRAAAVKEGSGLREQFEKLDRLYERINFGGVRFGRERRGVTGDPVSWLTRTTSGTALMRYGFRISAGVVILSMVSAPMWLVDDGRDVAAFLYGAGLIVVLLALGATGLGDEKARRTLSVLLATPRTAAQILHGKMRAALPLVLALFLIPAGLFLAFVVLVDPRELADTVGVLVLLFAEGVCAYFLAQHLSLYLASSLRAGIAAALTLAAVHAFYGWWFAKADLIFSTAVALALIAGLVALWASHVGRPKTRFIALLVAVILAVALLRSEIRSTGLADLWEPDAFLFIGLLLSVALLAYVDARLIFDRALGRAP